MKRAISSKVEIDNEIIIQFSQNTSESKKEAIKINDNYQSIQLEEELNENDCYIDKSDLIAQETKF